MNVALNLLDDSDDDEHNDDSLDVLTRDNDPIDTIDENIASAKTSGDSIEISDTNKIKLRYVRDGRRKFTYLYGLDMFVLAESRKGLLKSYQKELGAIMTEIKDPTIGGNAKTVGFSGDHTIALKRMLTRDLKNPMYCSRDVDNSNVEIVG